MGNEVILNIRPCLFPSPISLGKPLASRKRVNSGQRLDYPWSLGKAASCDHSINDLFWVGNYIPASPFCKNTALKKNSYMIRSDLFLLYGVRIFKTFTNILFGQKLYIMLFPKSQTLHKPYHDGKWQRLSNAAFAPSHPAPAPPASEQPARVPFCPSASAFIESMLQAPRNPPFLLGEQMPFALRPSIKIH